MAEITVNLNEKEIRKLIKYLENREKVIQEKTQILAKRLADLGCEIAKLNYGDSKINVSVVQTKKGFEIHAQGEEVCFIEFGAGVRTNSAHPYADKMPFDVTAGSWSVQDKQQFYTWGYWYFGGMQMNAVEPKNAMYLASRQIQEQAYKITKEVFND